MLDLRQMCGLTLRDATATNDRGQAGESFALIESRRLLDISSELHPSNKSTFTQNTDTRGYLGSRTRMVLADRSFVSGEVGVASGHVQNSMMTPHFGKSQRETAAGRLKGIEGDTVFYERPTQTAGGLSKFRGEETTVVATALVYYATIQMLSSIAERDRLARELGREIDRFGSNGWPVSEEVRSVVKRALDDVRYTLPLPQAKPSPDGEIGLFWLRDGNRVEVLFEPDEQRLVWIGKFEGEFVHGGDEPWSEGIPSKLFAMLERLYA